MKLLFGDKLRTLNIAIQQAQTLSVMIGEVQARLKTSEALREDTLAAIAAEHLQQLGRYQARLQNTIDSIIGPRIEDPTVEALK